VLGDISAGGSKLTEGKWFALLQKFQQMMGHYVGLPLHIVLGDRDVGECEKLDQKFVRELTSKLPGLDSAGCGVFEINNIRFVSLNAVGLLCGDNDLRFSIEKVMERENLDMRKQLKAPIEADADIPNLYNSPWRENGIQSDSGPIVLLHIPLHRTQGSTKECDFFGQYWPSISFKGSQAFRNRYFAYVGF
jgi:ethanolamine phosphate phosphodiesterase